MVAGIDHRVTGAFEPAYGPFEDGMTPWAQTMRHGSKFVDPLGGKDPRCVLLGLGQDTDRETIGG